MVEVLVGGRFEIDNPRRTQIDGCILKLVLFFLLKKTIIINKYTIADEREREYLLIN